MNIFEDLFVLEIANNHWGNVERGKKIIADFAHIVRYNNIKAAMKLQFRDVDRFIHKDFLDREDIRYINKTLKTKMSYDEYAQLVDAVRKASCITISTPFDEASVDVCKNLDIDIIKIASSDINDWILIEKIATLHKPVIFSTGGTSLKDIDDIVKFFDRRSIPLAINHCISLYPTEKHELELNQIDFLRNRYPGHVIGFSTHEYNESIGWGMLIAYAKGARTFERHIDIDYGDGHEISTYCSTPKEFDKWVKAYINARELCGGSENTKRTPQKKEIEYLDALLRGVYAAKDLKKGNNINDKNVYLAIPLQKGQLSCRELMHGKLLKDIKKDAPISIDDVDSPYAYDEELKKKIWERGL